MDKDQRILEVVARLRKDLGPDAFEVCDCWDADLCAVGLSRVGEQLPRVYISSFNQPDGRYLLDLDVPDGGELVYNTAAAHESIDYAKLRTLVAAHLDRGDANADDAG